MISQPSPPGDTIKDIMEERGISRIKLGKLLNIRADLLLKLLNGTFLIDSDMACRLSDILGSTPEFWRERERLYRKELTYYVKLNGVYKEIDKLMEDNNGE